ncbi:CaiB/BaiF CoA transferase family protein [Salirhabdus salicampi]|uniref:CaiB/BaiF CoA transferase family protein n=1 Tax=Salirhabdus salicampi TaxID=476102 RepID=UPI0020C3228B|nr:CoA transferase [Salirhabdus salicampi]MCP8615248.1 CoA transferase [Salirhabdus salicampi]
MSTNSISNSGPLRDIKILDFTRAYAGPFSTMLLADLGATVIKIEPPEGDFIREIGPFVSEENKDGGIGGFFNSVNRNKRSIAVDLKTKEGQTVVHDLVKECDALICNFSTPKVMNKFNLDYEQVKLMNPQLVYVSISGYGTNYVVDSKYEGKPTVDIMMQAESGAMSITGSETGENYKIGPGVGDSYAGVMAAIALLSAIIERQNSGKGQFIDIAMLDSMIHLCERIVYQYSYTGKSPKPEGNRHPFQAPYSIYDTKDGKIAIAGLPDRYWIRLCKAMDREDILSDKRFETSIKRREHQDVIDEIITTWTTQYTRKEAMEILDHYGCLAAPLNKAEDLFHNEHVKAREMLIDIEANPFTGEKRKIIGVPFKFSETKAEIKHRAPLIGEHSQDTLRDLLNYSEDQINDLVEKNVIKIKNTDVKMSNNI